MDIKRITMPKFKIGRYVLNYAELMNFRYQMMIGEQTGPVQITDILANKTVTMYQDGNYSSNLPSLAIPIDWEFKHIRYQQQMDKRAEQLKKFNPIKGL